jgi:hypothetical protein
MIGGRLIEVCVPTHSPDCDVRFAVLGVATRGSSRWTALWRTRRATSSPAAAAAVCSFSTDASDAKPERVSRGSSQRRLYR